LEINFMSANKNKASNAKADITEPKEILKDSEVLENKDLKMANESDKSVEEKSDTELEKGLDDVLNNEIVNEDIESEEEGEELHELHLRLAKNHPQMRFPLGNLHIEGRAFKAYQLTLEQLKELITPGPMHWLECEEMPLSEHMRHHRTGGSNSDKQKASASKTIKSCWDNAPVKTSKCLHCDSAIYSKTMHQPRKFCSSICREKWRSSSFKPEQRICIFCSSEFTATKRISKYCSIKCGSKHGYAMHGRKKRTPFTVKCATCSAEFTGRSSAKYCSEKCSVLYARSRQRHSRRTLGANLQSDG